MVINLLFWIFIVVTFVPVIGYLAILYNKNYWKRKGVRSPPSNAFFKNHFADLLHHEKPINFVFQKWTKQLGPVYGILEGWTKTWVIADPKMAHEMFVKKFENFHGRKPTPLQRNVDTADVISVFIARGARWKRLRTISSPSFSNNNLKRIFPIVDDSCQKLMKFVDQAWAKDESFNIHPYYHELTMEVICRVAMGQKETKLFDNEFVGIVNRVLHILGKPMFDTVALMFPFMAPVIRMVLRTYGMLSGSPIRKFESILRQTITERKQQKVAGENKKTENEHVDFIDLFLEAEDPTVKDDAYSKTGMKVSKHMTVEEIGANCFLFLLAGFDTTANTLAITTWLLTVHPDIQQRLLEEIDDVIGDGEITFDRINDLRYLDVIMKETLRMYPIASFACARECTETTFLGEFRIQKGENINIDVLTMHYDQAVWGENATEFVPERFFDLTAAQQMSYYPFGGGPRICIGMRLAYLEEKACLVRILKKYRFVGCPETERKLKMVGRLVWNPESVTVKLEKR